MSVRRAVAAAANAPPFSSLSSPPPPYLPSSPSTFFTHISPPRSQLQVAAQVNLCFAYFFNFSKKRSELQVAPEVAAEHGDDVVGSGELRQVLLKLPLSPPVLSPFPLPFYFPKLQVAPEVAAENGDDDVGRRELWQVAVCGEDLDDALAAQVRVHVLRHGHRHRQVLARLQYVTGDLHLGEWGDTEG
ncbi:unnamed protein product [Closterium sp. NIES-65]|nr:unnamed protein product [Closterium sp. NIES-65]